MSINKIALIGASSTGKTTVYELLKSRLPKYTFINESTRTVQKYGFAINEEGTLATQLAISSFHLQALLSMESTVYDRCYMDLLVYSKCLENIDKNQLKFIEDIWKNVAGRYTHFIYFPIEFKSVDDGVRSINEEWRVKVDEGFQYELQRTAVSKLTVTGSPMQRVEQILKFIK